MEAAKKSGQATGKKRAYVNQADVPRIKLVDSLKVAQAIADNYAKQPTKPLRVAEALGMSPTSGGFRELTGASAAYGLTDGTAWASEIKLTQLGRRAVAPTEEGDDRNALREAVLKPRVLREFLQKYDNSRLPVDSIALNVLEEMGVPRDACERTFGIIKRNAEDLGLVREISGQTYVDLQTVPSTREPSPAGAPSDESDGAPSPSQSESPKGQPGETPPLVENRRVFITHGKNSSIVSQLKELLSFGNFEPVVSVERESTAKPVPDKVLDDMRGCGAAIVHVGSERRVMDSDGKELTMLNPNVLIEIGAAMALYGRRFILLVEEGIDLPSNLQGLYEVRYSGNQLDYEATMKLLKAFNEFKT